MFIARDVIYTSHAYATMSVSVCLSNCLSICDVCALWSQGAMDPGYLCMLQIDDVFATY